MKKKFIITLFIMIIIIQAIMPIIVYADEETDTDEEIVTETDTETENETEAETQTQKKSFFDPNITFSWDDENDKINGIEYAMCIPSNANQYEKIPLILWLHGWYSGTKNTLDTIKTKESGIPYAVLGGSSLEKFSAYILCPRFPKYEEKDKNRTWSAGQIKPLLDKIIDEYNVDTDNIVIIGHSFGAGSVPTVVSGMPGYFSKAVVCSGSHGSPLSIPTKWFYGSGDWSGYQNAAIKVQNRRDPNNIVHKLDGIGHNTLMGAYQKDDGKIGRYRKQ